MFHLKTQLKPAENKKESTFQPGFFMTDNTDYYNDPVFLLLMCPMSKVFLVNFYSQPKMTVTLECPGSLGKFGAGKKPKDAVSRMRKAKKFSKNDTF